MNAQSWGIALTVLGLALTIFGLLEAHSTVRTQYLRALRQEARMRYLNARYSRDFDRFGALEDDWARDTWRRWASDRRMRQWKFWGLPRVRYADIDVAPAMAGRMVLAQALSSVTSDLVWVGLGVVASALGSVVTVVG
ncbi:hypothetical protein [Mycetocola miduiensis]|uniref:Uncharacterized protein n=1 Tax=Mycetocola miduiensis TaxID=995034 RepID=A0A1I5AVP8_9MICO|nr:hypothetical protein [Mycetocola miduiensis]SFN66515.1 hypothetical protein SAMN05216219_1568 [Mycetocola miduiensis]